MSTIYSAVLSVSGGDHPVGYLEVTESYNGGWEAAARFRVLDLDGGSMDIARAMGTAAGGGMLVGAPAMAQVRAQEGEDAAEVIRSFPGFIAEVKPYGTNVVQATGVTEAWIEVIVRDVVSHLADQPVWGVFRGQSAAEIVGGALSLAAGTDGKATLNPVVPDHSEIVIHDGLRPGLDFVPYAIAAGQTLGVWLSDLYGLLAIRMEMLADSTGELTIMLHDGVASATPLKMSVLEGGGAGAPLDDSSALKVVNVGSYSGDRWRAAVLDDPTKGGFRRLGNGPVGAVVAGEDIDLEEAAVRAERPLAGRAAELMVATVQSRTPNLRPGSTVSLTRPMIESMASTNKWQASWVRHWVLSANYANEVDLLLGGHPWVPPRPPQRPVIFVPARVDGGRQYELNNPVPRDRLGRIPVSFPFAPTLDAEDAGTSLADVNHDQRVTKDDFSYMLRQEGAMTDIEWAQMDAADMRDALARAAGEESWLGTEHRAQAELLLDTPAREDDVRKLRQGEYDDPYPARTDAQLTAEEKNRRDELSDLRVRSFRYIAWKRALAFEESGGDYDHDGVRTVLDERMSSALKSQFDDPEALAALKRDAGIWTQSQEFGLDAPQLDTPQELIDEYLRLYDEDSDDPSVVMGALQREAADEQWPPRLPLPMFQPSAGGMHGFVSGHRQGDACRVAVHDALRAEIVGFQYRSDRAMAASIRGATAGLLVEHDQISSWTGMVFRETTD